MVGKRKFESILLSGTERTRSKCTKQTHYLLIAADERIKGLTGVTVQKLTRQLQF